MSGRLVVRATRVGSGTLLAQITRLSASTGDQGERAAAGDRIAAVFVPCVIAMAVARSVSGWARGCPRAAWSAAVAVLVVACPCALGLATRPRCWPPSAAAPSWHPGQECAGA